MRRVTNRRTVNDPNLLARPAHEEAGMLIINGQLITWGAEPQILTGQALYVAGERIVEIGPQADLLARYPHETQLDAAGQYVMPGNICAHTHFYGAFARGLAIPGPAAKDFPEILRRLWWPLDMALDEQAVRYSALVCLANAIRHGTTTLIDHHASPNALDGSLDVIAGAVEQSGLRGVLCYEVTDRNGAAGAQAGIEENVRFIQRAAGGGVAGGRVRAMFGLHAGLTLSDETLAACRAALPAGAGFHIHVAEHESDEYDSLARCGQRVVDRLARHGILGPRTIVAHAVHVDAREVALLAESGTWVTHQPRSNMNNAVGVSEAEGMLRAGVRVCLGNDGFQNAMWEEWKTAYLLHKAWRRDPRRMSGTDVVQMAVSNNAALANMFFGEGALGAIQPGALADLIFVNYHPFTPLTAGNLPWHILFGFHESMVTTTIVSGQVLMRDGKLLTLDEEQIAAEARQIAPQVWERYNSFVGRYD